MLTASLKAVSWCKLGSEATPCSRASSCSVAALPRACKALQPMHTRPGGARRTRALAAALADREGGTGVLERPNIDWTQPDETARTESGYGATDSGGSKRLGGGDYRVLLLDSDDHTEDGVVKAVTSIVPGVDPDHARNCYFTARELGMAIITTCLKEHAEFYVQQLRRFRCRASMEPDTTTIEA